MYRKIIVSLALVGVGGLAHSFSETASTKNDTLSVHHVQVVGSARTSTSTPQSVSEDTSTPEPAFVDVSRNQILEPKADTALKNVRSEKDHTDATRSEESESFKPVPKKSLDSQSTHISEKSQTVFSVPFYSQFSDITPVEWRKIGCGIASLAMLIDFYEPNSVSVDTLLQEGIAAGAYLTNAGWTHAGLIQLSEKYGLHGSTNDLSAANMETAFARLMTVLQEGPVMASVHYTFDPKNPIPHLVVINGIRDGMVYYNDPADTSGGGSVSITKFKSSWKKRYIEVRPVS